MSRHPDTALDSEGKKKPLLVFIDDDQNEIDRFVTALQDQYEIVADVRLTAVERRLAGRRPALCVLDLYFPAGHRPRT